MKFLKRFLLLPLFCVVILLSSGCHSITGTIYYFYTNIPEDSYKILDNHFVLGGAIEGFSSTKIDYTQTDTTNVSSKQWNFYAMTASATLVVSDNFKVEGAEDKFTSFINAISVKLYEIEKAISSTVTNSDIYKFNNAQAGTKLEIKQITYDVLSQALYVYELTDGYYNPALYYNIQAYGFGGATTWPENKEGLPKDEVINKYTQLANHFGEVELSVENIDGEDKYFVIKPAVTVDVDGENLSLKLDLGGIGKGYAVDCIDVLFDDYGYTFGYFNFGTSSMLVKSNVQNGDYRLDISNPRSISREAYIETPIRNEKISTSGDDEQYYNIDGIRYCHIISPITGKPVQTGIMSATVIGGSAAISDALTTAIMAMEKQDAVQFIAQNLTDRRVVFVCE